MRRRLDDVAGRGWRLVLAAGAASARCEGFSGLTQVTLDASLPECDRVVHDWLARHGAVAALVRPDHYVFGLAATSRAIQPLVDEAAATLGLAAALVV